MEKRMEEPMVRNDPEARGRFWPIAFALFGGMGLLDYFYRYSFQPDDLLQGVGFLLMIPLAYLYPAAWVNPFKPRTPPPPVDAWSRWLAGVGVVLAGAGLILDWV